MQCLAVHLKSEVISNGTMLCVQAIAASVQSGLDAFQIIVKVGFDDKGVTGLRAKKRMTQWVLVRSNSNWNSLCKFFKVDRLFYHLAQRCELLIVVLARSVSKRRPKQGSRGARPGLNKNYVTFSLSRYVSLISPI
jgi:hypothetical protein